MTEDELEFCKKASLETDNRYGQLKDIVGFCRFGAHYAKIVRQESGFWADVAHDVCHGSLSSVHIGQRKQMVAIKTFITPPHDPAGVSTGYTEDFKRTFFNWVFNESPYCDAFITKDYDEAIKIGGALVHVDIDSGVQLGGLILTRALHEVPSGKIPFLIHLINSGVDYPLAIIVSRGMMEMCLAGPAGIVGSLYTASRNNCGQHTAFTPLGLTQEAYRGMVDRKVVKPNKSYIEGSFGGVWSLYVNTAYGSCPLLDYIRKNVNDVILAGGQPRQIEFVWQTPIMQYKSVPTQEAYLELLTKAVLAWQQEALSHKQEEAA